MVPAVPLSAVPTLYPLQAEGVERFLGSATSRSGRRLILAWGTGCGKTAGAASAMQRLAMQEAEEGMPPPRVLIVCPAIVRRHWEREVGKWAPIYAARLGVIEYGRERQAPSRAANHKRAKAYLAPSQVVSYDLLKEVDAEGWDLLIFDELHHLGNPQSKASKLIRSLVHANPRADVLGLTATLIPTEVKQIWNPLRIMFPAHGWGDASRTGDVSWAFAQRYCILERTEYGTSAHGCREDTREELRDRILQVAHFITRDQLRDDLPPLDVRLLDPGEGDLVAQLLSWTKESLAAGAQRVVVLTHLRATARALSDTLQVKMPNVGQHYIDGALPTSARDDRLKAVAGTQGPAVLVGTHGSLAEGVRLMWADDVAVAEWPQSPGRMVQILGRFQSVGSDASPRVALFTSEQQWGASQVLLSRAQALLDVTGPAPSVSKLQELMRVSPGDEDMAALLDTMIRSQRDPAAWSGEETGGMGGY